MIYVHRVLEKKLHDYLVSFPIIGVTGPRQSGKSTLLRHNLDNYQYVTFDDHEIVSFFESDPKEFFNVYNDKVIFDEVQKAPGIFDYLKVAVDNDRENYGKYVITGSSQFSLIKSTYLFTVCLKCQGLTAEID